MSLLSRKHLESQRERAEHEREAIIQFIRYVREEADMRSTKNLLSAMMDDIQDLEHYKKCYRR